MNPITTIFNPPTTEITGKPDEDEKIHKTCTIM
jgi:hypothetical protein